MNNAEKIPYWKSNRFLHAFVEKTGDKGCIICDYTGIKLSMDRAPPPLRDQPPKPKIRPIASVSGEKVYTFRTWLNKKPPSEILPDLPTVNELPVPEVVAREAVPHWMAAYTAFDLQDIPGAIRKLGMPKAAKMFDKWFSGKLNYSPTAQMSKYELNQDCHIYPPEMIDTKSISMDWVLGFERAKKEYGELIEDRIFNDNALGVLRKKLIKYSRAHEVLGFRQCNYDIQMLHKEFQFQWVPVDGDLWQKIKQYLTREVVSRGLPDELTFILGSFNIYAAVNRVIFSWEHGRRVATITHIYVYVKDGFSFTDEDGVVSQYLGHWNRKGMAVVAQQMAINRLTNTAWSNSPVFQVAGDGAGILHPVFNSDFRDWQLRHKQGGDYMIYTDLVSIFLRQPIVVVLE